MVGSIRPSHTHLQQRLGKCLIFVSLEASQNNLPATQRELENNVCNAALLRLVAILKQIQNEKGKLKQRGLP